MTKLSALCAKTYEVLGKLKKLEAEAAGIACERERALSYSEKVIPAMEELRRYVDEMETLTSSEHWPLPTYGDMMFKV